ncbi:MAG: type II toxin-antitoxin system prevent-host-death family antitoxin [Phycisphaerae bacterium]|nr:type II toxin-antitoxin system prevent-host-death family antitoxin [Phycisphaerae bacterium]
MTISLEQAQLQLAKLLDQVAAGEEMVITRDGRPIARLIPEHGANGQRKRDRVPGSARGIITHITPDFDAPLEDFREYME